MPNTLMDYDADKFTKTGKPRGKKAAEIRKRGIEMLKKMGESGTEIRKDRQMKRNKGLIFADTEPGAVDDDAKERIKRRKKMLEDAAG